MSLRSTPLFNDSTALLIGDRLCASESLLKSIDPILWALFDAFKVSHQRFTQRLAARRVRRSAMPELRKKRRACREVLEASLVKVWDNVPSVGSDFHHPKTRQEVRDERSFLCKYGKPSLRQHGDARLREMATEAIEYLTGSSALAKAWPHEHLEELMAALEDLKSVDKALLESRQAQTSTFGDLSEERLLWTRDFVNLRDVTARYLRPGATADSIEALFRDWTVEKPETTRRKARKAHRQQQEEQSEEDEEEEGASSPPVES